MELPTILEILARLEPLSGFPAALLVAGLAFVIVAVDEWRLSFVSLTLFYPLLGLLYLDGADLRITAVKLFTGWFATLILLFTAQQLGWSRLDAPLTMPLGERTVRLERPLRLMVLAGVTILLLLIATRPFARLPLLPETAVALNLAIWLLIGLGLVGLLIGTHPLSSGMALLLFLAGFDLLYTSLVSTVPQMAAMAILQLGLMLVLAYLAQVKTAVSVESLE